MEDELGQGSEQEIESTQGPQEETSEDTGGINPAWSELLGVVPSQLHSQVTPHLTKWDQGVQQKINQVHSQYEPYKPFIEQKVEPDQINYALGVMNAIENNPKEVLEALQAYIGESDDEQGQENQQQPEGSDELPEWLEHPEFKQMKDMVNTLAQIMVQQRESEEEARHNQELDTKFNQLREEVGEFDEEWVLTKMLNNDMSPEDAVKAYKEFESGILSKARQPGPKILGGGGSVPNQGLDPKNLDDKGRRSLVAQMLQQANAQNH